MKLRADFLQRPVLQSPVDEMGALGAAAMAFGSLGVDVSAWWDTGETVQFLPDTDGGGDVLEDWSRHGSGARASSLHHIAPDQFARGPQRTRLCRPIVVGMTRP